MWEWLTNLFWSHDVSEGEKRKDGDTMPIVANSSDGEDYDGDGGDSGGGDGGGE